MNRAIRLVATISVLTIAGCHQPEKQPDAAMPSQAADASIQPSASDQEFEGTWIMVDHSNSGHPLYIDKDSIVNISATRKAADIAYIDDDSRTLERVIFICDQRSIMMPSEPIGRANTALPDLIGEFPREEPHLSALDYVCLGKVSKPERGQPALKHIPPHL
mgnify:CR=1 FL=1